MFPPAFTCQEGTSEKAITRMLGGGWIDDEKEHWKKLRGPDIHLLCYVRRQPHR
jgi:hypothetical protein